MVETITPAVHGGRKRAYWTSVALHTMGAAISAALVGLAAGALGALIGILWTTGSIMIAGAAALYAARELFGLPVPIPQQRRQVPDWWRSFFSPHIASFLYGVGLGFGYLTHLSFGTFFVVSVAAFASGDPLVGALLCAPFGIARGLSVALTHEVEDAEAGTLIVDRLERFYATRGPKRVNAAVLALTALALIL
jgi:hypothetical protein